MTMNGIDISDYQRGLDLSKVPCDFVICKATEGTTLVHRTCDPWIQLATQMNKKWGFYHFLNTEDVIKQADFFVSQTKNYFGHGIPILDYEMYGKVHKASGAWKFINRVHDLTGIWCMFYTNRATLSEDDFSQISQHCALWVAQYANNNPTGYQSNPWLPAGSFGSWSYPTVLQYSSNGRLNGYSQGLDLDLAYLDSNGWDKIAKGDKTESHPSSSNSASNIPNNASSNSSKYESYNTLELVALVQEGKLGNGDERKRNLGSKYQAVQDILNHIYGSSTSTLADDVMRGTLGNGNLRKRVLGSKYDSVQKMINQRCGIGSHKTYVVKSGDTLSKIAHQYGVSIQSIARYNGIRNVNLIYPGQKIVIP